MGDFKVISNYTPSGDQPDAICKLAEGIRRGDRFQTLLGATGTGKSVAWDEPVTVHLGADEYYRGPIGKLADRLLGQCQPVETLEIAPPKSWRVLAWDAETGQVQWQRISGVSRHRSPEQMYRLTSACGRDVTVTGDHSVWVLRGGQLHLLPGSQVQPGDALPVPTEIPEPAEPILHLNLLHLIDKASRRRFRPSTGRFEILARDFPQRSGLSTQTSTPKFGTCDGAKE